MNPTQKYTLAKVAMAISMTTLPGLSTGASPDSYPTKTVTVIVPHAPGGANDAVARIFTQKLTKDLGQSFVVDNRPGAGGNIGTGVAARAPKDGYTLLLTVGSTHTINPSLYQSVPFQPVTDFEPIAMVATAPYVLVVNPSLPAKNVKELIALAKSKPGQIDFASAGNGTLDHLLGEMFKSAAGVNLTHVPYKGAGAANTDLVAGRVQVAFGSLPGVLPFVKAGKLRLLAVVTEKRSPLLPDVPTVSESLPGYSAVSWYGLLAPAGTPKAIVAKLRAEAESALADPDLKEKLAGQGAEVAMAGPDQFASIIKSDLQKWAKIVQLSGAKID